MSRSTTYPGEFSALLAEIVAAVRDAPNEFPTKVVAVDGPGGAGKSTFAERLAAAFGGCQIVHTDDFASWENPIDWWPELIEKVRGPLSQGQAGQFQPSPWEPAGAPREQVEVVPAEVLILEGVTASREAFRPYLTYAIWIDASHDTRLRRGLERDGEEARPEWERSGSPTRTAIGNAIARTIAAANSTSGRSWFPRAGVRAPRGHQTGQMKCSA